MDYNLQGLSSRSFEQLIQALSTRLFGPQVMIFGDGPDGGREATFDGHVAYRDWSGYGVVQAKFRQRLTNPTDDGAWATKQLRSELQTFVNSKKRKRKPEYYIFATNLVLSAVEESGAKDQCLALLEEYSKHLPLKGFDVWDYDKLRVFIDNNDEIRKGYAAWITPGDVLSEVIHWFKATTPNFDDTLSLFLQKELLSDQYVNLEQAGHSSDEKTAIARVFVDLPFSDQRMADPPEEKRNRPRLAVAGVVAELIGASAERLDPQTLGQLVTADRVGNQTMTDKHGRYVITGGPGQGKTTVGQYICQLFRTSILQNKADWQLDPEAKQVMTTIAVQATSDGLHIPTARRFPIRIILSQFAKALASNEVSRTHSLLSYIIELIRRRTDQEISPSDFRRWLSSYPWVIVFDGLDEVPASSNRDAVLNALRDFRIDARSCNADVLGIATTRPQGYNEDFSPALHRHIWLTPLSPQRAMHYARRLVEVRYGNDGERTKKILARLERASNNETTARLMRSPLQVTIMTTLVDRMGQPPQERWNLFKEYYKVIYQREVERDIPAAIVLRDYQPDVDTIHSHVGLLLQLETERSGQTDARLSLAQFDGIVHSRLRDEGHKGTDLQTLKAQIIEAAMDRLVFLVGLQSNQIGFEIRSLQEFMAAEGLMDGTDELVRKRLRVIAPISNWRNVFLFAAGKCFVERQHLRDTIHVICAELNDDMLDPVLTETLAGSRLALDLLEDGPARRQPKYAQSLARIAFRLLDLPPEIDHIRLSALYERALDVAYQQEIQLRISHLDPYCRLGAWATLLPLVDSQYEWAERVAEEHWPTEPSHQLEIFRTVMSPAGRWLREKAANAIPRISPHVLLEDFQGDTMKWFVDQRAPGWLKAANELLSSDPFQELLWTADLNHPAAPDLFSLQFLAIGGADSIGVLREMPNPSPEWSVLLAAVIFASSPSIKTFISAVETLALYSDDHAENWLIHKLPWPLASYWAFRHIVDLQDIKRLAESGELGHPDLWVEAEQRWTGLGFSVEDILHIGGGVPFDKTIADRGFPFSPNVMVSLSDELPSVVLVLLSVYEQLASSPLRPWVASWLLFVLSSIRRHGLGDSHKRVISIDMFRKLISDAATVRDSLYLDGLDLIDYGHVLTGQQIEFFDWLGRLEVEFTVSKAAQSDLPWLLASAFKANPDRIGLLRSLSLWMTESSTRELGDLGLLLDKYPFQIIQKAALSLKILQGNWPKEDLPTLAKCLAEFIESPAVFFLLANPSPETISSHGLYPELLTELRRRLPTCRWREEAKIVQRLSDSIRRRSSELRMVDMWIALGLPAGLIPVLPQE